MSTASILTVQQTVAESIGNGLQPSNVVVNAVAPFYGNSRRLRNTEETESVYYYGGSVHASIILNYTVTANAGAYVSAAAAFSAYSTALSNSVTSGVFKVLLNDNGYINAAYSLYFAIPQAVVIKSLYSSAPTPAPVVSPTLSPTQKAVVKPNPSPNPSLFQVEMAAIILGSFCAFVILCVGCYTGYNRFCGDSDKEENEEDDGEKKGWCSCCRGWKLPSVCSSCYRWMRSCFFCCGSKDDNDDTDNQDTERDYEMGGRNSGNRNSKRISGPGAGQSSSRTRATPPSKRNTDTYADDYPDSGVESDHRTTPSRSARAKEGGGAGKKSSKARSPRPEEDDLGPDEFGTPGDEFASTNPMKKKSSKKKSPARRDIDPDERRSRL